MLDADRPETTLVHRGAGTFVAQLLHDGSTYLVLGIEHILGGIDHLLFVLGLVVIVGFEHRLFWTITAFTLAHSITLACSVLGVLALPQGPVEAVIALSILLLAVELSRGDERASLTRRAPAFVAFVFGLLHGFGFAGALRDIGLPEGQVPVSLAAFNIGVEIGQLGVVAIAWLVALALRRVDASTRARLTTLFTYALGCGAAYWAIERSLALFR